MSNWRQPDQLYAATHPEQLTLRDHLARDRTVLANERTLLSYVRTAFALLAAGGALIKLFPQEPWLVVLGVVLSILGAALTAFGFRRFVAMRRNLRSMLIAPPDPKIPATSPPSSVAGTKSSA